MSDIQIRTASDFQNKFNVSRETLERLENYSELLALWQKKMNLVSSSTMREVWQRHIADSAQLFSLTKKIYLSADNQGHCYDLGSGAGFPGLVIAIMAAGEVDDRQDDFPVISMVEGSAKKCAFMREVIRKTGAPAKVINKRIESLLQISNSVNTRLITARALAPLDQLFEFVVPAWGKETKAFFMKGSSYLSEIRDAEKKWQFEFNIIPSLTSQDSVILEISALGRKEIEE